MPHDDIVTCKVKGLLHNFFRGKNDTGVTNTSSFDHSSNDNDENDKNNINHKNTDLPEHSSVSKEYCVASIYRSEVHCPFIHQIRVKCYEMDPDGPIPDSLQAVGWMDGATSPLKFLTEDENKHFLCISEYSYNLHGIPKDCDSKGNVVERPSDIHLEN